MKNLFFLTFLISFVFSSCENDSLSPLPVKVEGQFVKFEITKKQLVASEFETTAFGGLMTDLSGTIVKYDLYVRRTNAQGYVLNDYVKLQTITSFPFQLSVTPAQIAQAIGMNVADLQVSDVFRFKGFSYDASGKEVGYLNLSRVLQTTDTMQQGYKFNTDIVPTPQDLDPKFDNRSEAF